MERIAVYIKRVVRHLNIVQNLPKYFDEDEQRLVVQSIIIGVVVGLVAIALKRSVHVTLESVMHWVENAPTVLVLFVPLVLGALVVTAVSLYRPAILYYRTKEGHIHSLNDVEGDGLERAISLFYTSEPSFEQTLIGQDGVEARWELPTLSLAIRKIIATFVTLGSGGSGGLEGSVTLIGESLAAAMFKPRPTFQDEKHHPILKRIWRWWSTQSPDRLQTAQLSGIAAAIAVLLGAPFAAAFFAVEVMYRYRPVIEKLVYALLSSLVAFFLTDLFTTGHPTPLDFETVYIPPSDLRYFLVLALLGVVISIVSQYFKRLRSFFDHFFHEKIKNPYVRHVLGITLTGVIALGVHEFVRYYGLAENGLVFVLGPGETAVEWAFAGKLTATVAIIALVAKMIATLTTITSGGSAGLLIPTLFFGTMTAAAFAQWFEYEPMMLIVPAMTASLVSIANVPLAAILFVVEVFGSVYMVPSLIMLVIATILAHEATIYRTQRETFEAREIMPGVSVRRVSIPAEWAGHTLVDLDFRKKYDLNVIGLVERRSLNGQPRVRLGTAATTVLEEGDTLIVLGKDEKLASFERALMEMDERWEQQQAADGR
jgi:CIC family chloride channel protein